MKEVFVFMLLNIFFISFFIFLAYIVKNIIRKRNSKKPQTFTEFLNVGKKLTLRNVMIGLIFGIVFGFLDNFGLWMGISVLENYMPGGVKTKSALGNTYSDFIGATIGSAISILAAEIYSYDNDDTPLWVNTVGILIGCILGMLTGRLVTGKN